MRPTFDDRDATIKARRLAAWNTRNGPRVGDFVIMPDLTYQRFSHDWGDSIQTSEGGSFYLGEGYASFSGGLNPSVPKSRLVLTDEIREGSFWFFHHDFMRAHNGVYFTAPCRVYRLEAEAT